MTSFAWKMLTQGHEIYTRKTSYVNLLSISFVFLALLRAEIAGRICPPYMARNFQTPSSAVPGLMLQPSTAFQHQMIGDYAFPHIWFSAFNFPGDHSWPVCSSIYSCARPCCLTDPRGCRPLRYSIPSRRTAAAPTATRRRRAQPVCPASWVGQKRDAPRNIASKCCACDYNYNNNSTFCCNHSRAFRAQLLSDVAQTSNTFLSVDCNNKYCLPVLLALKTFFFIFSLLWPAVPTDPALF